MSTTSIEWTDATWNPVTGCDKISPGCKNCYAEKMANRLKAMGQANYRNGFELTLQPHMLELPLRWKTPKRIFVNSMSDLFHEGVPLEYIQRVFQVMNQAHWHQYQILTKRAERLEQLSDKLSWAPHVWMGVSIESEKYVYRIDHLRQTGAHVKFLSLEPLLGPLGKLNLEGVNWVIIGGESGPGARAFDIEWARNPIKQCGDSGVACFVKQWGARPVFHWHDQVSAVGLTLGPVFGDQMYPIRLKDRKGGDPQEWPEWSRVRQFPEVVR